MRWLSIERCLLVCLARGCSRRTRLSRVKCGLLMLCGHFGYMYNFCRVNIGVPYFLSWRDSYGGTGSNEFERSIECFNWGVLTEKLTFRITEAFDEQFKKIFLYELLGDINKVCSSSLLQFSGKIRNRLFGSLIHSHQDAASLGRRNLLREVLSVSFSCWYVIGTPRRSKVV